MDIADVRSLAASFSKAAGQLEAAATHLDADLSRARWLGPDAATFRSDWNSSHRAALRRTATSLRDVSRLLVRQADQQDDASRNDGGVSASGAGHVGSSRGGSAFAGAHATGTGKAPTDIFSLLDGAAGGIRDLTSDPLGTLGDIADTAMRNAIVEQWISEKLGFEYQGADKDFYTTNQTSIQSHLGFMDLFDDAGFALGMDLDDSVNEFEYGGREYKLELWKGSYGGGSAFGGEIGLYIRDPSHSVLDSPGQAIDGFYPAAAPADRILSGQTIYNVHTGEEYFTNEKDDPAYWNLAIRTDPGIDKSDLGQRGWLQVDDPGLRREMAAEMRRQGLEVTVDPHTRRINYVWE
ncbi:DUF4474 domain-containing protein [Microbacterium sp. CJ88]|uniref:DUF4474 domain-containing protein n=1 Tax=Microbacterium sp. CJ88 TaxID=3445672 RepID=UPI003F65EA8B